MQKVVKNRPAWLKPLRRIANLDDMFRFDRSISVGALCPFFVCELFSAFPSIQLNENWIVLPTNFTSIYLSGACIVCAPHKCALIGIEHITLAKRYELLNLLFSMIYWLLLWLICIYFNQLPPLNSRQTFWWLAWQNIIFNVRWCEWEHRTVFGIHT